MTAIVGSTPRRRAAGLAGAVLAILLFLLAAPASPAAAAPCPGTGSSACPYDGVSVLDPRPLRSPRSPAAVAVSPLTGHVYVADRYANRVKHYGADGALVRAWGGRGYEPGRLDQPVGIDVGPDGDVWVAELNNNRISRFTAGGELVSVYGTGQGAGTGQLFFPEDVAVAPDGHVWVADTANDRVVELAADGTVLRTAGATGSLGPMPGSGAGEFSGPEGIAVTSAGDVWVADTGNNRLQRLPAGGSAWEPHGAAGSAPGEFLLPHDVAADGTAILVADDDRTQRLAAGAWTEVSPVLGGDGIDAGAGGRVLLAQLEARRVLVLDGATGLPEVLAHPIEPAPDELLGPQAVAADGAGHLYVADTAGHRIVRLDAVTGAVQATIGGHGSDPGELDSPWGVAVDGARIVVADSGNHRIQVLEADGTHVASFGGHGQEAGRFESPFGVAVAPDGSLVVADTGGNRIQRSSPGRTSWTVVGGRVDRERGGAAGEFYFPGDVAVTPGGDLLVADSGNDRLQKLPAGATTWQPLATAAGLDYPRGLDVAPDGSRIAVADTGNARVVTLDATGATTAAWGDWTPADDECPGEFSDPWGIAVAPDGAVLVSDRLSGEVERFTFGSGTVPACDHAPPAVGHQSPHTGATTSLTPAFAVTGSTGAGDGDAVRVRVFRATGAGLHVVRTLTSSTRTGSTWSVPWEGAALPAGAYSWDASQADAAGNRSITERRAFTAGDGTPPPPPPGPELAITHLADEVPVSGQAPGANPVLDDRTPTFAGTAGTASADGATLTVRLRRYTGSGWTAHSTFKATRGSAGAWSATPPMPLAPDTYEVTVSQPHGSATRTSSAWWFQVQALTVTQLATGVPVGGSPPGTNPGIHDTTPTLRGTSFARPGDAETVTLRFNRWNGTRWEPDVRSRTVPRNANGVWEATPDPPLAHETWAVRVTQQTAYGSKESDEWWFHLPADPPLAVTQLDAGTPVSGAAPGANPVLWNPRPVFRGTASLANDRPASVSVQLDRWNGTSWVDGVHRLAANRDARGAWQVTPTAPLADETWRVRVRQGAAESAAWFMQTRTSPPLTITHLADGAGAGEAPGANPALSDTTPTFRGTAGIRPGESRTVTVQLARWDGRAFVPGARTLTASVDERGAWSVTAEAPLPYETYAVKVVQDGRSSPEWYFHLPRPNAKPEVVIRAPRPGVEGHYKHGYAYPSDFSCTDDQGPPPVCEGSSTIDTSSPGRRNFVVRTTDASGVTSYGSVEYVVEPKPASDGIEVQGVELSQGTQTAGVEAPEGTRRPAGLPFRVQRAPYQGTTIVAGKRALARVFVHAERPVRVLLHGYRKGGTSLGAPLTPVPPASGSIDESATFVGDKQRNRLGGHAFLVPAKWTAKELELVAVAVPDTTAAASACTDCDEHNGFMLSGIAPEGSRGWNFALVHFKPQRGSQPGVVDDLFRFLETVPVADDAVLVPDTYSAEMPLDGDYKELIDDLIGWDRDFTKDVWWHYVLGVAAPGTRNAASGRIFTDNACFLGICSMRRPVSVVSAQGRPLGAVGHEVGHVLGRRHAGCGDTGETASALEAWAPDNKGYLQGIGLDVSAFARGEHRIYDGLQPTLAKKTMVYDHMSYCAPEEARAWVSPKGWEIMLDTLQAGTAGRAAPRRAAARQAAEGLAVQAVMEPASTTITSVSRGAAPVGPPDSPVRAVAYDGQGARLADVPMLVEAVTAPHGDPAPPSAALSATVPADTARVEVVLGGQALASRSASPSAPQVRVTAPQPGAVAGRSREVRVAWEAGDRDGDALTARVEYSRDGGATWRLVTAGQAGGEAWLSRHLLARASRALVRVTVSDGWHEATATSGAFRSLGAPPAVTIRTPARGTTVAGDTILSLAGQGTDDAGRRLPSRALRWYDGRRPLGRGASLDVRGLRPGRRTVRLVGRDAHGRTASDAVRVRVRAAAPQLLALDAPRRVSPRARRVVLRVTASMPATLRVGRRTRRVGPVARRVVVPVRPGSRDLALRLRLQAHGRRAGSLLVVRR